MGKRVGQGWGWLVLLGLLAGCAGSTVVLTPGKVPMPESGQRVQGDFAWSLWVDEALDLRGGDPAGREVGTLYTRFRKEPQIAYLEEPPEQYVKGQLERYLLHRGLAASTRKRARILLVVEVEEFEVVEVPGSVWDEIRVLVGYTVRLGSLGGGELGKVKLDATKEIRSPGNTRSQVEAAFREMLADTFEAMFRSPEFQRVLEDETL